MQLRLFKENEVAENNTNDFYKTLSFNNRTDFVEFHVSHNVFEIESVLFVEVNTTLCHPV